MKIDIDDILLNEVPEKEPNKKAAPKRRFQYWRYSRGIDEKDKSVWDDQSEGEYRQYMMNLVYGNFYDTILYINELNMRPTMTNRQHYEFLYHLLDKKRRFYTKFEKEEPPEHIDEICEACNISPQEAREVLSLLTPEQLKSLLDTMDKGGKL